MERGAGCRDDDSAAAVSVFLLRCAVFGGASKTNAADGNPARRADPAAAVLPAQAADFGAAAAGIPALRGIRGRISDRAAPAALSAAAAGTHRGAFADAAPKDGGSKLIFTTGGEAGTYFGFGGVLAQKVSEVTSTNVTAITSGGSAANIDALDMGDAQLGFSQSDVLSYAYTGVRSFEDLGAITNFSIVAPLYMEQVQIVTMNPDIKSVADLAGKSVSIGAAGSGVYFNAIDVLGAYGLTEADIKPTYQSFGDSAEALQDGQIDAAFIVAGAPTTAVTSLATTKNVYLVSLDDEHIDALIAESPFYAKAVIPAATYNMPEDATTVAVSAVVIASNDVADVDVYNFLCGVFENLGDLAQIHDKANELSLEFASSFSGVPYHSGAVQYFADKGITVEG